MPYLIDSNVLIQAKNEYYAFNLCPGFWEWIDREHEQGNVFSIEQVREELMEGNDKLAEWADERPEGFFLPPDAETANQMSRVTQWVMRTDFKESARRDFLAKADPVLIATALAYPQYTVVSHEILDGSRRKVKIPNVCHALGVRCERTFSMLTKRNACFGLLPSGSNA